MDRRGRWRTVSTIFISYRRENTAGEARALFNDLVARLGKNSVFMDVDNIALGRDFRSALQETTASCDLMLVLIGRSWADAKDEGGRTRLEWSAVLLAHPDRIHRDLDPSHSFFKGVDLPVESITWNQAEEFCLRLAAITRRAYRARLNGNMPVARGPRPPSILAPRSPRNWRITAGPVAPCAAIATASASPRMSTTT